MMKKLVKFSSIPVGDDFDWYGRICHKAKYLGEDYNAVHSTGRIRVMLRFPGDTLVRPVQRSKP